MRRLIALTVGTMLAAGFALSSVRADSIDITATSVTGGPGAFLYTYTISMGEGETTTPGPSFLTVVDFAGLTAGPIFTPAVAIASSTSAPPVGSLASNFGGTDSLGVPDLEVDFAPGYTNPLLSGEVLGTLSAISLYGPKLGVYSSLDYFSGVADPNFAPTEVPNGPVPPPPVPVPASLSGGMCLFVLLAAGKLITSLRAKIA
jgi:hypothetical protein